MNLCEFISLVRTVEVLLSILWGDKIYQSSDGYLLVRIVFPPNPPILLSLSTLVEIVGFLGNCFGTGVIAVNYFGRISC